MSDNVQLEAAKREVTGKKVKQLRTEGKLPAVIHEKGKESVNIEIPIVPFTKAYQAAGSGQPVDLSVGSDKHLTMIKEVSVDPAKNSYTHAVFHAINKNDPVEAEIPVHFDGDVNVGSNFVVRPNDTVLVKALPNDLPEELLIPADKLQNAGDTATVADIIPVAKVEILVEAETPIAVVEEPKAAPEPEETEEVDAADVPSDNGGDSEEAEKSEE